MARPPEYSDQHLRELAAELVLAGRAQDLEDGFRQVLDYVHDYSAEGKKRAVYRFRDWANKATKEELDALDKRAERKRAAGFALGPTLLTGADPPEIVRRGELARELDRRLQDIDEIRRSTEWLAANLRATLTKSEAETLRRQAEALLRWLDQYPQI